MAGCGSEPHLPIMGFMAKPSGEELPDDVCVAQKGCYM